MKSLFVVILVALSLSACQEVKAADEYREVYTQYADTVQIVLTNQPCLKWEKPEGVQLNYAYAVDSKSGEKVTGCFTHDETHIIVILSDDERGNKHYDFKINPDSFKPRGTL